MSRRVMIVLATYNGARHLGEQLQSLQAQTHTDWTLLLRDDSSVDGTLPLVRELARKDERIVLLEAGARLGAVGNFGALLVEAHSRGAEAVFLCDQDDVWLPDKVRRQLSLLERLEQRHGRSTPLLVHSDLEVVDESLGLIHPSYLGYQRIAHEEGDSLAVLLVQNFVTGCATLVNRPLLDFALPLPLECVVHDWWLAQCAASAGRLGFDPIPTVRYRQHAHNAIGAGGAFGNLNPFHAQGRRRMVAAWRTTRRTIDQAGALHRRMVERGGCAETTLELAAAFASTGDQRPWERLRTLARHGLRRQRPLGTALFYARMALLGLDRWGDLK